MRYTALVPIVREAGIGKVQCKVGFGIPLTLFSNVTHEYHPLGVDQRVVNGRYRS